jgi:DNA repair exonuclease SbcCD ATPase subunit
LPNANNLQTRVESARKRTERDYERALKTVEKLKNRMNELEQDIIQKKETRTIEDLKVLDSAINRLDGLTDSEISRSRKAREEYRRLEQQCKTLDVQPVQLDDLRAMCKKMEEPAADLLCYSLGRFRSLEAMKPPLKT